MASPISVEFDEKALARFRVRAERWQGTSLSTRMGKGTIEAARLLVRPIRAEAPVAKGGLRRSVKARAGRAGPRGRGFIAGATVGPTAPHRHLVTRGTNRHSLTVKRPGRGPYVALGRDIVRLASTVTHPGAKSDPFVDRAAETSSGDAFRRIRQEIER